MGIDQQRVLSKHREKVKSGLGFLADMSDTKAEAQSYVEVLRRLDAATAGRGPELDYEDLTHILEGLDAGADGFQGEPEEAEWVAAHTAVADLLHEMQPGQLRPHLDPIQEALDVARTNADTPEEEEQAVRVGARLRAGEPLDEEDLAFVTAILDGGADVYRGQARQRVFEKAADVVNRAKDVARPRTTLFTPPSSGVDTALDAINRHRRGLGMSPLDPAAAGWSEQDVLDEAERIARFPNLGLTP